VDVTLCMGMLDNLHNIFLTDITGRQ